MTTERVGKGGTVVIPAKLRRRFGLAEGVPVVTEARDDGVLVKRASPEPATEERYQWLIEETNRAYAALRADPEAWREELAERALWDATLLDGLDANELWTDEGGSSAAPSERADEAVPRGDLAGGA